MSSFTDARFEPVLDAKGKPFKREGRKVYAIRGHSGDGMTFHIGYVGSGLSVRVPEGFQTDGPSVPTVKSNGLLLKVVGVVASVVPQSAIDRAMKSAAVHDYLCEHPRYSRADADAQFWAAMHAEGTPGFWRDLFFKAVTTNNSKARYNDDEMFQGEPQPDLFDGVGNH